MTKYRNFRRATLLLLVAVLGLSASCNPPTKPGPVLTREPTRPALAQVAPSATPSVTARPPALVTQALPQPTPASSATPTATASPSPVPPTSTYDSHLVQPEETLLGIAALYSVSVDDLVEANGLANPNQLQQGQALLIPPSDEATPVVFADLDYGYAILGFSAGGRAVEVFSFGEGPNHVVFVGGMHGGFEWNSVLLAHEVIDYFNAYRDDIPAGVTIDIIPVANPDGLFRVTGSAGRFSPDWVSEPTQPGRFNDNGVDLNRNWDCEWSPSARWAGRSVDPGSAPFSEPETRAIRDYLLALLPQAVIFWHSMANLVAPASCGGNDAGSARLAAIYGEAAGYPVGPFTAYEVTGDASTWVAAQGIPAITVELATKDSSESGQNLAGVFAVLELFSAP